MTQQGELPINDDAKGKPGGGDDALKTQIAEQGKLIAELQKSLEATSAEKAKAAAKAKKEEEDARRKDADAESLRKELADRDARLESINTTVRARAELLWAKIPEASQKKLEIIKGDLDPMKLIALLENELAGAAPTGDGGGDDKKKSAAPPPTGAPVKRDPKTNDRYTPTPGATEMLDKIFKGDKTLRDLDVLHPGQANASGEVRSVKTYTLEPRRFVEKVMERRQRGTPFTLTNSEARKR